MKRLLTILLISVLSFISIGSSVIDPVDPVEQQQETIYKRLGTFKLPYDQYTKIEVDFYITKQYNNTGYYPELKYIYKLKGVSKSTYQGALTSTWLHGTRIFINGSEASYNQSPNGFTVYVRTTPMEIYYWYTLSPNIDIGITWDNSTYDPRKIR